LLDIVDRILGCAISGPRCACKREAARERSMARWTLQLTDGGIETRIIYEFKRPIGGFKAYQLLADEAGRDILQRI
jgi:hypothetical protein